MKSNISNHILAEEIDDEVNDEKDVNDDEEEYYFKSLSCRRNERQSKHESFSG